MDESTVDRRVTPEDGCETAASARRADEAYVSPRGDFALLAVSTLLLTLVTSLYVLVP